jgi:biotin transport system substrate-specific component
MHTSKAFVPYTITQLPNKVLATVTSIIIGVGMLSLLAQLKIILPWTPVPITGQTFGVALLALLWGSRLSLTTFATYLGLGFLGAPIFASGLSGLLIGPTFGYLVGMLIASWVIGKLSDKGWGSSFKKAFFACYLGSAIIFSCGLVGLSFFIPSNQLFFAGVLPFLVGDLIKNTLAAFTISRVSN